ncbi:hypothetical protein QCE80_16895, partial [Staphylococcus aureus]|nr:hypothetical protein [Staphylococcus aureus]
KYGQSRTHFYRLGLQLLKQLTTPFTRNLSASERWITRRSSFRALSGEKSPLPLNNNHNVSLTLGLDERCDAKR